jgi:dihydrofolate reductase/thymidylate synthase
VEQVFVIGGGQVYSEAMQSDACAAIHLTLVEAEVEADTFFPAIDPARFRLWSASPPRRNEGTRLAAALGQLGSTWP